MKLILTLLGAAALFAQASVTLERAIRKETLEGDLKGAIALFEKAYKEARNDRATAAKALVRLAECHQKLGDSRAKSYYEQIVREFGDQKEAVATARLKLGASNKGTLSVENLYNGPRFGRASSVSPDGRFLSYQEQDSYKLILFDTKTKERRAIHDADVWRPLFSPDGKTIAFGVATGKGYDLALLEYGREGAPKRFQTPFRVWAPLAWFPAGDRILVMATSDFTAMDLQIGTLSTADGRFQEICKLGATERLNDMTGAVSVDGKWVVFEQKQRGGKGDRDIYIVASSGGTPRPLISDPSEESLVGFAPNGTHLLMTSTRDRARGLYAVPFADGKTTGNPIFIASPIVPSHGAGWFDQQGNFYFSSQQGGEGQLFTASLQQAAAPRPVPMRESGGEVPAASWVADSKRIIFHRFGAGRMIEAVLAEAATGTEVNALQTSLQIAFGAYVRPDGSAVLNVPPERGKYAAIDWNRRSVEFLPLKEGKTDDSKCGGPLAQISTNREGIWISDFGSLRQWQFQARTDLTNSSTLVDITPDCGHMVRKRPSDQSVLYSNDGGKTEREIVKLPAGYTSLDFPKLSSDGARVYFILGKGRGVKRELWSLPVSGGTPSPTGIELVNMRNPRLSPDEKQVLLSGGEYIFEAYRVSNLLPDSMWKK